MAIEIELDGFSGRRNPSWVLEPEQEAEFLTLLTAVQSRPAEAGQLAPKAPPLGYRGFKIRSTDSPDFPELIEIYAGTLRQGDRKYEDRGRELEKWLLETAGPFVSQQLVDPISREFEQSSQ